MKVSVFLDPILMLTGVVGSLGGGSGTAPKTVPQTKDVCSTYQEHNETEDPHGSSTTYSFVTVRLIGAPGVRGPNVKDASLLSGLVFPFVCVTVNCAV